MNNTASRIQRFAFDIIYYVLWIIEAVLLLSFILKLLGANPFNQIVAFLHGTATVLMGPIGNFFGVSAMNGMVVDPSLLVAMVSYAIIAYILIALLKLLNPPTPTTLV